jgi:hypothetical protein
MPLTSHDLKNRDCLYKKFKKKNNMKFSLFFVLLSIFAIIALTHPSAGSGCKCTKPCCKKNEDCILPPRVGVYCETRIPCGSQPDCGTCRPVYPCFRPCCLKNSDCDSGICNVKKPCKGGCGTCEPVNRPEY